MVQHEWPGANLHGPVKKSARIIQLRFGRPPGWYAIYNNKQPLFLKKNKRSGTCWFNLYKLISRNQRDA